MGRKPPPIPRVRPHAATTLLPSLFSRPQSNGVDRRRPLEQRSNRASLCKHKSPSSKRGAHTAFQQWPHLLAERWSHSQDHSQVILGREMVPSVQDPIAYGLVGDRVGEMNANECHECRFGPERAHSFCVQEHDRQPAMASRNKLESLGACELGTSSIKVNLTAHMNLMNTRGDCARTHRRHLRRAR